jgi:hypothetical protein
MPKLNDTQLILLSTAAQRDGGSLLPLPETLTNSGDRATRAMTALIKQRFAEERETADAASVHRTDGDIGFGVFITEAGIAAIDGGTAAAGKAGTKLTAPKPERISKSAAVVALLQRDGGATLAELIAATGWLPHTTRAALTGLRKKGHGIERGKRGDETCYHIAAAA